MAALPTTAMGGSRPGEAGAYSVLILIAAYCAIPFLWVLIASLDSAPSQFLAWPRGWTLDNYIGIFTRQEGLRWVL
ncbi:MAG: hypothetical protein JO273_05785, partial [Methylobacteriaceae bacterium]|nr:hypothetical protein [Methylobacteriaceae bacterium]